MRQSFKKFKQEMQASNTVGPLLFPQFLKEVQDNTARWTLIAVKTQLIIHLLLQLIFIEVMIL